MPIIRPDVRRGAHQRATMLARFFRGLDDPTRVRILELLLGGEKSVSELVELTGSPQGRVSTHLGCLRHCGYVTTRREGRWVYYRLADDRVRALLRIAQELMADHAQELLSCALVSPDVPGATIHEVEDEGDRAADVGASPEGRPLIESFEGAPVVWPGAQRVRGLARRGRRA